MEKSAAASREKEQINRENLFLRMSKHEGCVYLLNFMLTGSFNREKIGIALCKNMKIISKGLKSDKSNIILIENVNIYFIRFGIVYWKIAI